VSECMGGKEVEGREKKGKERSRTRKKEEKVIWGVFSLTIHHRMQPYNNVTFTGISTPITSFEHILHIFSKTGTVLFF